MEKYTDPEPNDNRTPEKDPLQPQKPNAHRISVEGLLQSLWREDTLRTKATFRDLFGKGTPSNNHASNEKSDD